MDIDKQELKSYVFNRFRNSESLPLRSFYKNVYMKDAIDVALDNDFFIKVLIFNNDKFNIAGNYTFAAMFIDDDMVLNKFQKSLLGAFIRYIFEFIGYEEYTRTQLNKSNLRWGRLYRKVDV